MSRALQTYRPNLSEVAQLLEPSGEQAQLAGIVEGFGHSIGTNAPDRAATESTPDAA